jgi:hypothetical protein
MPAKHSPAGLAAQAVTRSPSSRAVGGRLVGMDPLEIGDRLSGDTTPRLAQGVALADLGQPQFRLCAGRFLRETRAMRRVEVRTLYASAKSSYSSLDKLAGCAYTCLLYGGRAQRMDWARREGRHAAACRARESSPCVGDKTCRGPPGRRVDMTGLR